MNLPVIDIVYSCNMAYIAGSVCTLDVCSFSMVLKAHRHITEINKHRADNIE